MRSTETDPGTGKPPARLRRPAEKAKPKRVNQAGRPTAAELERRKGRVMDVATELFVRRGYAATSLVDIAKGAGVATRTLYQHFGDKEAMFREVIFARDIGAVIPPPRLEADDTITTVLRRSARYAIDVSLRQRSIDLMRLMVAESHRFPEFMQKVATSIFMRFRRNIAKVFEAAAEAGLIVDGDHTRSAELFTDLILGNTPIMTYTNWETAPPTGEDLDERVDLFIRGRFGVDPAAGKAASSRGRKPRKHAPAPHTATLPVDTEN
ncbi:TetR/AcrR family transcriptional regulator [Sphingomonas solaris]|uniref:TetR/AcrR family transcriptional regulator n=1 Tax=Alterirhizorhabdus solaris TaxID=2529389 RepID=A0A558RBE7_9SPHN|nr:TetR/AcrR family transcriptional regulator [Sphingomonas solaris]TVV76719.1 TetR/AcrR family transcriptional regulator [Sphingomonas solaris]